MDKITKNGRDFYKFKIGDEFVYSSFGKLISGMKNKEEIKNITPTLNNLLKCNWTSINKDKIFNFNFYDSSTKNNHVSGFCKYFNFEGIGVKVSELGGHSILVSQKIFVGKNSGIITSKNNEFINEYISHFLNNWIPRFSQGTTQKMAMWSYYKNEIIYIPTNHKELAKVIKRVNEYKQLSKQLSKQLQDYKLSILQTAEKEIEKQKQNGNHDKYISFRIGDEFTKFSGRGKGMFSTLNGTKEKTKNNIFELYTNVTQNIHISGYVNKYNFNCKGIKWTEVGDAGATKFINYKVYIGEGGNVMVSNVFANEYIAEHLARIIPKYTQGSTMRHAKWPYFKDVKIHIPKNHNELSKIIKQINDWEEIINKTTKKMEKYIEGVLQLSLKGVTNE